jgi:serine phosphatase RsbU (regulator of sigma subunit)
MPQRASQTSENQPASTAVLGELRPDSVVPLAEPGTDSDAGVVASATGTRGAEASPFPDPAPSPAGGADAIPAQARRAALRGRLRRRGTTADALPPPSATEVVTGPDIDLPPNDPLVAYLLSHAQAVDITALQLDSPGVTALRAAGAVLVIPLISSGSLVGLLSLGPRRSERGYSSEDKRLLTALAGYAAPAMRVGQLVRQQQAEARSRERIEQELKIAQIIQQQFLPSSLPDLPGWNVAAFYRPARTVGGDFYDFIGLPDGRVMCVVGDVTDKGIPAALVMASTHALLRAAAQRLMSPGAVLAQVNDLLYADIPAHMFVTCLCMVLDPASGAVVFANAGHDVPYVRTTDGIAELRARGMPLGLMPGMTYDERSFEFRPGDCALLHSDGLAEAHGPDREMFGFPRVSALVARGAVGAALIDECLTELREFTGPDYEQEDDITLVSLERSSAAGHYAAEPAEQPARAGSEEVAR